MVSYAVIYGLFESKVKKTYLAKRQQMRREKKKCSVGLSFLNFVTFWFILLGLLWFILFDIVYVGLVSLDLFFF